MHVRGFLIAAMTIATTMAVYAADQPARPEWRKITATNGQVVIFGAIARPGYYALPEDGMSLTQLVVAAGIPEKAGGAVIQLRRSIGKNEAKIIEVEMHSLVDHGNIPLEPNDIVQVLSTEAAR